MGILNKRNAVLGWTAWQFGKRMAKKKAMDALPGRVDDSMKPNKGAIVSAIAAIGGALWFWRRSRGDDEGQ